MNFGIIDIGSNTVRLNVYSYESNDINMIFSKKHVVGLVSYIQDSRLTDKGITKLVNVLHSIKEIISHVTVDKTIAFATASLRKINNTEQVLKKIEEETGFRIKIYDQELEARLGFEGIMWTMPYKDGITVDIGGGSTEIIRFKNREISQIVNYSEGSLSLFNRYVKGIIPTEKEIKNIQNDIKEELYKKELNFESGIIIGIGGTIRAIGDLSKEAFSLDDNRHFTNKNLTSLYKSIIKGDEDLVKLMLKIAPDRIHTITPGMVIFKFLCKRFGAEEIVVSSSGLREGVLLENVF
ncbi:MAG: phosphatase [Clostridiales bacterium]|nr:phosphatase [Clostridiales bacterium]MDD7348226.1 phosphatase [Clostridiales bacterium]MDY4059939.1 hypothetical protein [Anaerovoracaceae bacterium]